MAPGVFVTYVEACKMRTSSASKGSFAQSPLHFLCLIIADMVCRAFGPVDLRREVLVGSSQSMSKEGGQGQWRTILASKSMQKLILYKITPVTLPHVQPIQLSSDATNPVIGQNLTIVGFDDDTLSENSSLLMEASVQVVNPAKCDAMVKPTNDDDVDPFVNKRTQFCTGTRLASPCEGAWRVGCAGFSWTVPLATFGFFHPTPLHSLTNSLTLWVLLY